MFQTLFDLLTESPQAYVVLFAVAAGDAILPALPSESAVILAGVLSGSGSKLDLRWVIAVAALGAFTGDNTSYLVGRSSGRVLRGRLMRRPRVRASAEWARRALERRGGVIVVTARFIPGGRTAVTLTAGLTRYPYPRFALFAALAAVCWAVYAALLGYLGGRIFHDHPWLAVLVAFGIAAGIAGGVELVRRARRA